MADAIDFGHGSWAEAAPVIRTTLEQLHYAVNGNGKPGLVQDVVEIKSMARASLVWLKGIGIVIGIGLALATFYVAYLQLNHRISRNEPQEITQTQHPQHAGTPVPVHY